MCNKEYAIKNSSRMKGNVGQFERKTNRCPASSTRQLPSRRVMSDRCLLGPYRKRCSFERSAEACYLLGGYIPDSH
eukprot:scaffold1_cov375-Pavlova_lutheri.AAC.25